LRIIKNETSKRHLAWLQMRQDTPGDAFWKEHLTTLCGVEMKNPKAEWHPNTPLSITCRKCLLLCRVCSPTFHGDCGGKIK